MQCRYVGTYVAHEVALPSDCAAIELYADHAERTFAILTPDPSELLTDADRGAAIANAILRGVFGSPDARDVEIKIGERVQAICDDRLRSAAGAPFLVVSVDSDEEPDLSGAHTDQPGYSVYFDAVDKQRIRATARPIADRVVAAAIIASDRPVRYDRIGESIYLRAEDGRVIYPLGFTGHAASLSVRSFAPELPAAIARYAAAARATKPDLSTVFSLLRAAADGGTEPLRAFISAWSALEILTNKVFKQYERLWFEVLAEGREPVDTRQLSRVRDVMQGKYKLVDSFSIMASILAPGDADADIEAFAELKGVRDQLFHGGALSESTLPAHQALALVRKYVRLHLDQTAA